MTNTFSYSRIAKRKFRLDMYESATSTCCCGDTGGLPANGFADQSAAPLSMEDSRSAMAFSTSTGQFRFHATAMHLEATTAFCHRGRQRFGSDYGRELFDHSSP